MIKKDIEFLIQTFKAKPTLAIILGSGQTGFHHLMNNIIEIKFEQLASLPEATIKGHPGKLVFGTINNQCILIELERE